MTLTDADANEQPVGIRCRGSELSGILHRPENGNARVGLLLIVGGPQYRIGSHRQFVQLARALAAGGVPVLRFDYGGMGDCGGELRDFEQVDGDIRAALDHVASRLPNVERWVLWGLCDAASAASFYAFEDPRVGGLVLLNPWVRTEAGAARATLKHYYLDRLRQPDFWRKVMRFDWNPLKSLGSATRLARRSLSPAEASPSKRDHWRTLPLPERMLHGLERFDGPVLLVLSGRDLTAREFEDVMDVSADWQQWRARAGVRLHRIAESDHTFSRRTWSAEVERVTLEWLREF